MLTQSCSSECCRQIGCTGPLDWTCLADGEHAMDDTKVTRERGEEEKGKEGKRGRYRHKKQDKTRRDKEQNRDIDAECVQSNWVGSMTMGQKCKQAFSAVTAYPSAAEGGASAFSLPRLCCKC